MNAGYFDYIEHFFIHAQVALSLDQRIDINKNPLLYIDTFTELLAVELFFDMGCIDSGLL
jgi:hypothetical protein